jgi:uncharacterized protein YigE (DUF2233 family)
MSKCFPCFLMLLLFTGLLQSGIAQVDTTAEKMLTYIADPKWQEIRLYWKDSRGQIIGNFGQLKKQLQDQGKELLFATNGGMFTRDRSPLGLFIQQGKLIHPLDTASGPGNFYLKPNGIFYVTEDRVAGVCTTENFPRNLKIKFATQSGPMLVTGGKIHPAFIKGSANLNIRSGVGLMPDGRVVFVLSKQPVNFYDFAEYFKSLGCLEALYLDGFVSRTYLPAKNWVQTDGDFGVIIGIDKKK